jgi:poly(3-hydroxybutyrate) depolymerase
MALVTESKKGSIHLQLEKMAGILGIYKPSGMNPSGRWRLIKPNMYENITCAKGIYRKLEMYFFDKHPKITKTYLPVLFILLHYGVSAQYCTPCNRFTEAAVFTETQIDSAVNVVYGSALDYTGTNVDLKLNIYYPSPSIETLSARPLIVLMHGGMFISGDKSNLTSACMEFAKRGYVAATIGYRLGWDFVPNCQLVTPEVVISSNRAIYRAIQDLHASVRYLVHNAAQFSVDTAWIFAGGVSAGAFATADMAFITAEEFAQRWPYCNDPQFGEPLGYINTNGNALTDTFTLKGLFHNWGSVVDNDYIRPSTAIPMIGFAGELDEISPIDSGFFESCVRYDLMFGTRSIFRRLGNFGVCSEVNIKLHAGHGVYNSTYEQGVFRIGRASCFFKSLFCGTCASLYTTDSIPPSCSLITSTKNLLPEAGLQLCPNPSNGQLTVISNAPKGSLVKVYTLLGELLYCEPLNSAAQELQLCHLPDGVYIVEVNGQRSFLVLNN